MLRDIIVCGHNGNEAEMVFKKITIAPNLDLEFAFNEEIEKFHYNNCNGFMVTPPRNYSGKFQTIIFAPGGDIYI